MSNLGIFLILRFEKLGWTWFYFLLSECLVHCQETSRICLQNIIFLHPFVDVILFRSACHGFCSQDCTSKWLKYKPHHKVSNINSYLTPRSVPTFRCHVIILYLLLEKFYLLWRSSGAS